jgi:hypothetical protein
VITRIFYVITKAEFSAAAWQSVGNLDDTADNRAIKHQTAAALQRIVQGSARRKRMTDGRSEIQQPAPR